MRWRAVPGPLVLPHSVSRRRQHRDSRAARSPWQTSVPSAVGADHCAATNRGRPMPTRPARQGRARLAEEASVSFAEMDRRVPNCLGLRAPCGEGPEDRHREVGSGRRPADATEQHKLPYVETGDRGGPLGSTRRAARSRRTTVTHATVNGKSSAPRSTPIDGRKLSHPGPIEISVSRQVAVARRTLALPAGISRHFAGGMSSAVRSRRGESPIGRGRAE
jgi:hypothetical protein